MSYNPTVWKNRIVQFARRFRDQDGKQVTLTPDPGVITEAGTIPNAALMNKLEQGVADAHTIAELALETIDTQQGTIDGHISRKDNPHGVTVAQIGAETPAGAQGKVDAHANRKDNPHAVTAAQVGAETPAGAQSRVDTHNNATSVHGATSAATASRIMMRDGAGRAQVAAPSAAADIARKDTVDAVQTNLNNHTGAASPHSDHVKGSVRITVSSTAPASPAANDIWIQI